MSQYLLESMGDFVVHMESNVKCLSFGQITMPAAGQPHTLANVVAYPILALNVLAVAGDEANVVGFIVAGEPFEDLDDDEVTDGPLYTFITMFDGVVLNEDVVPADDLSGAAFNLANMQAAAGLAGIKWVSLPDESTEQFE